MPMHPCSHVGLDISLWLTLLLSFVIMHWHWQSRDAWEAVQAAQADVKMNTCPLKHMTGLTIILPIPGFLISSPAVPPLPSLHRQQQSRDALEAAQAAKADAEARTTALKALSCLTIIITSCCSQSVFSQRTCAYCAAIASFCQQSCDALEAAQAVKADAEARTTALKHMSV